MQLQVIETRPTGYGLVLVTVRGPDGRTAEGCAYAGNVELARYRASLKLNENTTLLETRE